MLQQQPITLLHQQQQQQQQRLIAAALTTAVTNTNKESEMIIDQKAKHNELLLKLSLILLQQQKQELKLKTETQNSLEIQNDKLNHYNEKMALQIPFINQIHQVTVNSETTNSSCENNKKSEITDVIDEYLPSKSDTTNYKRLTMSVNEPKKL